MPHRGTSLFEHIASQKFQRSARLVLTGHRRGEKMAHYSTPCITKQPIPPRHGARSICFRKLLIRKKSRSFASLRMTEK
jgi:hypothetical protein